MRQDTNVVKKVENSNVTEVIMDECNNPHTETLHTHCLTLRENEKNLVERTKKYTNTMTLEQKLSKEKTIDNKSHKILTIKRKNCIDEIKHLYKGMNEYDLQEFNIEYDRLKSELFKRERIQQLKQKQQQVQRQICEKEPEKCLSSEFDKDFQEFQSARK